MEVLSITTEVREAIMHGDNSAVIRDIGIKQGMVTLKEGGLHRVRERLPNKDVWCYTGCVLEQDLLAPSRWRTAVTDDLLSMIDVLVDGPFVEALKDISLPFRGSSNQRILHLRTTDLCATMFSTRQRFRTPEP